jgi:hypothetical protein
MREDDMRREDSFGYRSVEYSVSEKTPGEWDWSYYPNIGHGVAIHGHVKGTRTDAVNAVKAAIDEWLQTTQADRHQSKKPRLIERGSC